MLEFTTICVVLMEKKTISEGNGEGPDLAQLSITSMREIPTFLVNLSHNLFH